MKPSSTYDASKFIKAIKGLVKYVDKTKKEVIANTVADQAQLSFDEAEVIPVASNDVGTIVLLTDESTAEDELAVLAEKTLDNAEEMLTERVKEALK